MDKSVRQILDIYRENENSLHDNILASITLLKQMTAQFWELFVAYRHCSIYCGNDSASGGGGGSSSRCVQQSLGILSIFHSDKSNTNSLVEMNIAQYMKDLEEILYKISKAQRSNQERTNKMKKIIAEYLEGDDETDNANQNKDSRGVYSILSYSIALSAFLSELVLALRKDAFHFSLVQHTHHFEGSDQNSSETNKSEFYDFSLYSAHFNGRPTALCTSQLLAQLGDTMQRYTARGSAESEPAVPAAATDGNMNGIVDYDAFFSSLGGPLDLDSHVLSSYRHSDSNKVHTFFSVLEYLEGFIPSYCEELLCDYCGNDDAMLLLSS